MGFLNDLLKVASQVKSFAEDIQSVAGEYKMQESAAPDSEYKPQESTASADIISLHLPAGCDARDVASGFFYDTDSSGTDYCVKTRMSVDRRFHMFSSGAAEVDISFAYSPEIKADDEYAEWNSGTPYISVGYDDNLYEVLTDYTKKNTIAKGNTVSVVTGSDRVKYKTVSERGNERCVAYHFYRGFNKDMLYQIAVCYPLSYRSTEIERICIDAVEMLAATYTEQPERE